MARKSRGRNITKNRKRLNHNRRNNKTKKKIQVGGFIEYLGLGLGAIAAMAAVAFAGYKYTSIVDDKNIIDMLLSNASNIEYLPRYSLISNSINKDTKESNKVPEDTDLSKYIHCISNTELIDIIRDKPELLKSVTINSIIKNIGDIDPSLSSLSEILSNYQDDDDEFEKKLTINTIKLSTTDDPLLNQLKTYLLATSEYSKNTNTSHIDKYNKLAASDVNWIDIIFDGGSNFDLTFDGAVDKLLEKRQSLQFITPEIVNKLKSLKEDYHLIEAINRKMKDCANTPDGYMKYITSDIKWNQSKNCLECDKEDCLIYIHEYYYEFLNKQDNIDLMDKIYMLMLCEARCCLLSKCIVLEAFRQERGDKKMVKDILNKIYDRDVKRKIVKASIPEEYSEFTTIKKPTKVKTKKKKLKGGGDDDDIIGNPNTEKESESSGENSSSTGSPPEGNPLVSGKDLKATEEVAKAPEGDSASLEENPDTPEVQPVVESIGENPVEENLFPQSEELITPKSDEDDLISDSENTSSESLDIDTQISKEMSKETDPFPNLDEPIVIEDTDDASKQTTPETETDSEYLNLLKELDKNVKNYLLSYNENLDLLVNEYNKISNDNEEVDNLERRNVLISKTDSENIEGSLKILFPLFRYVLVPYNRYMDASSITRGEFENYYDLYANYPIVFSFVSPRLIGIRFFKLGKDLNTDYWNYDMSDMVAKANKLCLEQLLEDEMKDIIYKFITICLLSSKTPVLDEKMDIDVSSIDTKKSVTDELKLSDETLKLEESFKELESIRENIGKREESPISGQKSLDELDDLLKQLREKTESIQDRAVDPPSSSSATTPSLVADTGDSVPTPQAELPAQTQPDLSQPQKSQPQQPQPQQSQPISTGEVLPNQPVANPLEQSTTTPAAQHTSETAQTDNTKSNDQKVQSQTDSNTQSKNTPENEQPQSQTSAETKSTEEIKKETEASQSQGEEIKTPAISAPPTTDAPQEADKGDEKQKEMSLMSSGEDAADKAARETKEKYEKLLKESSSVSGQTLESAVISKEETNEGKPSEPKKEEDSKPAATTPTPEATPVTTPTPENPAVQEDTSKEKSQGGGAPEDDDAETIKVLKNTSINVGNLDYILDNSEMLSNVVDNISYIYAKTNNKEIETFITYICKLNNPKYSGFINYFSQNNMFMNSLDSESELFTILNNNNIFSDINSETSEQLRAGKKLDEQRDNFYSRNTCKTMKDKLKNIIRDGGPITLQDAYTMEYCEKTGVNQPITPNKVVKTLKKDKKSDDLSKSSGSEDESDVLSNSAASIDL